MLKGKDGRRGQANTEEQRDRYIDCHLRRRRPVGNNCRFNNGNVIYADGSRNTNFLVALQEGIIELAVRIRLSLVDVILNICPVLPVHVALQLVDFCLEFAFALLRLSILTLACLTNAGGLARNRGVYGTNLLGILTHSRELGLKLHAELCILGSRGRALLAQAGKRCA